MNLQQLTLGCFRNYQTAQLDFDPGVNLIVGDNAQEKPTCWRPSAIWAAAKASVPSAPAK